MSRVFGSAVLAGVVTLAASAVAAQDASKWGPYIDLGGKWGTDRSLGEGDLFLPLHQSTSSLLFTDLRGRFDDNSSSEGNFGFGYRQMLGSGWNLGGYGYLDIRSSENNNTFYQATFGAEALSLDWDLRTNVYVPLGDRTRDLGTSGGGAPFAELNGSTIEVVTPGGMTREERALGGFDAEIGWRLPVFAPEDTKQLRFYGGGYWFDDDTVDAVTGPRARLEFVVDDVPGLWEGTRLTLGAEVQHDDVRDTQGFLSVGLRIPLQAEPTPARSLSPLERRMTDPIVRDIDVVTQTRTQRTPGMRETATETAGGSALAVISDTTNYGPNLTNELTTAGANSTVILSGTFNTTSATTLQPGQTLMGAGTLSVRTPSGRTATLTTPTATITQTAGSVISINAASATVSGLTIKSGNSGTGVQVSGPSATVTNNTITITASDPSAVSGIISDAADTIISGNTVTLSSAGGTMTALVLGSADNVLVTGNTLSALTAVALNNTSIAPGSTGNVFVSGGCTNFGSNTGTISFTANGNAGTCP